MFLFLQIFPFHEYNQFEFKELQVFFCKSILVLCYKLIMFELKNNY